MYRIKDIYKDKQVILKFVNGKHINLMGKTIKKIVEKTDRKPMIEQIFEGATQEDLKYLFESGYHRVEKVEADEVIDETVENLPQGLIDSIDDTLVTATADDLNIPESGIFADTKKVKITKRK